MLGPGKKSRRRLIDHPLFGLTMLPPFLVIGRYGKIGLDAYAEVSRYAVAITCASIALLLAIAAIRSRSRVNHIFGYASATIEILTLISLSGCSDSV